MSGLKDAVDLIEPAAESTARTLGSAELGAQLSIAISLKRIADVLTDPDFRINDHAFTDAAYQAGLAFERGRR